MDQVPHKPKSAIDNLKPKTAFKAGLMTGLGIMFIIGFFILLGVVLTDKTDNVNVVDNGGDNVVDNGGDTGQQPANVQLQAVDKNNDWIRGDKNAKVSIIEFSDIDCPFCGRFHTTMKQVLDAYDGQINWVYRHFPLTSLHPDSAKKAEGVECVGELGGNDKVWEFLDKIYTEKTSLSQLGAAASSIGINSGDFQTCLDSGKYRGAVSNEAVQAQAAGGRGTPHSIIVSGDTKIPISGAQPFDSIKASLDTVLK
jgi:protein-disulfide isomerase